MVAFASVDPGHRCGTAEKGGWGREGVPTSIENIASIASRGSMIWRDISIRDGVGAASLGHASRPLAGEQHIESAAELPRRPWPIDDLCRYRERRGEQASFNKAGLRRRALAHLLHQHAKNAGPQSFFGSWPRLVPVAACSRAGNFPRR